MESRILIIEENWPFLHAIKSSSGAWKREKYNFFIWLLENCVSKSVPMDQGTYTTFIF